MAVIKCPHCGKETIDICDICLKCGKKINEAPQKVSSVERKSGINIKLILFPLIILLIVLAVFLILKTFDIKNNTEPAAVIENTEQSVGKKTAPASVSAANSDTEIVETQFIDTPAQAPTIIDDDIVRFELDHQRNFNINYCDLWGVSMSDFERNMGAPTFKKTDHLIYKNASFDEYSVHAVFSFNDDRLECAAIKFLDTENRTTVVSNFRSISDLLNDEYGEPTKENASFHDFTKKLYGKSLWEQPNYIVRLELLNPQAKFDMTLTYSVPESSYQYYSIDAIINSEPGPLIETNDISGTDFNANLNYDEYWGMSRSDIINAFGIECESGDDYLVYRNVFFGIYASDAVYYFDNDRLCFVGILNNPEYQEVFSRFDSLNQLLRNKFNNPVESYDDNFKSSYSVWETQDSTIILRASRRGIFSNSDVITYRSNDSSINITDEILDSKL